MNIVLEPDVEQWVSQEARRVGIAPDSFVTQRLREQRDRTQNVEAIPDSEGKLLAKINEGLPADFWTRYRELAVRRDAEILTEAESAELIAFSDRVEQKNAERLPYLIALAQLRGISLTELIQQLGLSRAAVSA